MSDLKTGLDAMKRAAECATTIHEAIADAIGNPSRVWCRYCGRSEEVNAAECLRSGWPECCDMTMTIDEPEGDGSNG